MRHPKTASKQPAGHLRLGTLLVGGCATALASGTIAALTRIPVVSVTAMYVSPFILPIGAATGLVNAAAILLLRSRSTLGRRVTAGIATTGSLAVLVLGASQAIFSLRLATRIGLKSFSLIRNQRSKPDIEVERYTSFNGNDLGMSIWTPRGARSSGTLAPIVVGVHGGGWTEGDRHDLAPFMKNFADRGFLAISVSYSLSDSEQLWDVQESQIADALSWIGENAATYGGDINQLVLSGASAGGNLAFNVASKVASGSLSSSSSGIVPRPTVLSIVAGASDIAAVWNESDPVHRKSLRAQLTKHLGGSPADYPDRYDSMSSIRAVTSDTPPTVWLYGPSDHIVSRKSSERMIDALRGAGVPTEVLRVPFGDHLSVLLDAVGNAWVECTVRFFDSHRDKPSERAQH